MSERTVKPFTERQEKMLRVIMKVISKANTWLYLVSGGKVGGRWLRGAPVLLLTTIGRRSGKPRTTPLLYLRDGDSLVLVGSKGGVSHHPLWYWNLRANPDVEIQIGTEKKPMRARQATEEEKTKLWPELVRMYRDFQDYQDRTERNIPVIILSPR